VEPQAGNTDAAHRAPPGSSCGLHALDRLVDERRRRLAPLRGERVGDEVAEALLVEAEIGPVALEQTCRDRLVSSDSAYATTVGCGAGSGGRCVMR
jgi:hypothetical protein